MFQCPTTGFLLFYGRFVGFMHALKKCFNALPRAFFFSTKMQMRMNIKNRINVSMPYHGLSSFLPKNILYNKEGIKNVSMPYHGLSSFLHEGYLVYRRMLLCFNALPRAFFFSTGKDLIMKKINKSFNALPRAFFFSTSFTITKDTRQRLFQCPTTGFLLFYADTEIYNYGHKPCFNALPRAFFFSTLCLCIP